MFGFKQPEMLDYEKINPPMQSVGNPATASTLSLLGMYVVYVLSKYSNPSQIAISLN